MTQTKQIKKIPIEEVMEFFNSEGMEVTQEEAEKIMEFLYSLTLIVIKKYFDNDEE
ncbi:hypothetical protein [Epilithonimonas lactis]|uniref:hypothetical protein n=1 Tax=Epilithonimonas lactis TaxID=421072 RepID=UPI0008CBD0D5|nr:hypothetical protein [Epilithonimonas lactis]SEQ98990.1 hypothetical protein SAMN04488097_3643 [Epilithonimonas lactis]